MDLLVLEELGLSKNEIQIYLTLLQYAPVTTGKLIQNTGIASSRIYIGLQKLMSLGLATYSIKNNIRYFQGVKPDILLSLLEEKRKRIHGLIIELQKIENRQERKAEASITIYEGLNGFRHAFELLINTCTSKNEISTLGFSRPLGELEKLRSLLRDIDRKRIHKKIPMKILLSEEMRDTIGKDRKKEPYTSIKFMPQGYFSPSALNISKDYVFIELWEEIPTVIVMKNPKIAKSFKHYFKFLWKIAHH